MPYYADLTSYTYLPDHSGVLNVGWLDARHPFDVCVVPALLQQRLRELAFVASVNQTSGCHRCELCHGRAGVQVPFASWNGQSKTLGSAEIRVVSGTGISHACPDLIVHYVGIHNYCPPVEFLVALHQSATRP
jgi:hypothetical protein